LSHKLEDQRWLGNERNPKRLYRSFGRWKFYKGKVDELIEGALKAKKITPAQRQHYETLCATDEGLTSWSCPLKVVHQLG
jgi:hypothetical protein